jgi:exosome complex component RRP4
MGLLKEEKTIVTPGEILAEGMDYLPGDGTMRKGEDIIATVLGLMNLKGRLLKITPVAGGYLPAKNDMIIGKVVDIIMSGWRVEINSAYSALLPLRDASSNFIPRGADLTQFYTFDDYIACKISNVTSQNLVDLTMRGPGLKKLVGGRIIEVSAVKVPRIIGKNGSMVSMLKRASGAQIVVGQNGLVWVDGEPENEIVVIQAVRMIEKNAHKSGLTENVHAFLEERLGPIPNEEGEKR